MASSSLNGDFTDLKSIVIQENDKKTLEDLKKRAYIPENLPEDFLRIILNENNIPEDSDSMIARQLHFNLNRPNALPSYTNRYQAQVDFGRGRLQIDVVEAKLNKNYGITRMDPYVRFILGKRVFETPTAANGSKNPIWKKRIVCNLPHNVDTLSIEIYDEKSFTQDELIAFVKYPLPSQLFDGIFVDEWIPLSGRLGEHKEGYINIHLLFTPVEAMGPRPIINQSSLSSSSSVSSSSSSSPIHHANPFSQPNTVNLPQEFLEPVNVPKFSEEDFKSIKEMFPSFDDEVIKSIMESSRFDKEATIDALLQMSTD
ncbi:unnamed protein product [Brachionus calyciflorus]|uniref:Toll-interacting protein n=1 Tax=Brachionus calyciflorus TaxID=104777 RepID=A0A813SCY1_9BILA|nr:unnamed protein product [Brachionus calyciflorus]